MRFATIPPNSAGRCGAGFANRFRRACRRAARRRSPPRRRLVLATRSGLSPIFWRKATCRCRHSRGFLPDHHVRPEKHTDHQYADRARALAAPAAPSRSCRAACWCAQLTARRAHSMGMRSSPVECIENQPQRCGFNAAANPHASAMRQLDLDRIGGRCRRCRNRPISRHHDWHELRRRGPCRPAAVELAQSENQIGVHIVLPGHDRHRCAKCERRQHDLPLERLRPHAPFDPLDRVHYRASGHLPPIVVPRTDRMGLIHKPG